MPRHGRKSQVDIIGQRWASTAISEAQHSVIESATVLELDPIRLSKVRDDDSEIPTADDSTPEEREVEPESSTPIIAG